MDEPAITRVFISYSHDSAEHRDRVRLLADRLIRDGVDCVIDLDEPNPPEGWWRWMDRQLADADFVLVVCTAGYFQKATARRQAAGQGATFESVLLVQTLYDSWMENKKFIPVLFADLPTSEILPALRPYSRYRLDHDAEYTELLRHLTGQPKRVRPPLGRVPELPPEESETADARIGGTTARPEAPRQPRSASASLPAAFRLFPLLRQRWPNAFLGGLLRRRIVLPAATLALLAVLGVAAARWLCTARTGLGVQAVGIPLLSSFCTPAELYVKGVKLWEKLDTRRARQLFEKAIAKQPDYWLAYSGLAVVLHELGQDDLAAQRAKLACHNAANLSREERLLVTARCSYVERRWDDAIKNYEELRRSFPYPVEYGLGLVKALGAAGRYSDAMDTVHSLQAQPSMAAQAARLYLAEAEVASELSDYKRMYAAAAAAEHRAERQADDHLKARAWLLEGIALYASDPENALAALKRAEDLYLHTEDRPNQAHALDAAAEVLLQQGRLGEARGKTDEALEIFQEVGDRDGQAHQHLRLAAIEFDHGNDIEAEKRFAAAIGDFRLAGNRSEEARFTSNLGFVLYRRGHHEEAVKYYQKALSLYRALEDRSGEAQQLIYLAEISLQQLSLGEAEARLAAAQDLATAVGNQHLNADALAREGDVAAARAQLDVARQRYRDAQAQHQRIGDTSEVAQGDLRLASLELDQCENTLAQSDARKAIKQFHVEQVEDREAQAEAVLALALVAAGSLREAESEIEKAERLAKNSRDPDVKIAVALARGRLDAAAGTPEEALHQLDGAIEQAERAGLRRRVLEVRLARGEIEVARGDRRHAAEDLTSLEKEARSHGFSAIADRAAWVRAGGPAGVCHSR